MTYTILDYLWFFIVYAFLGWCVEVSYQTVHRGKFINRGFLNGPVCPIYGFGMIILIYCLNSLANKPLLLFIGSFFLTTVLEFITGFILEKVFNDKWWDYANEPFNIKGYVCLSFSIAWGLGAVFMLIIVHPSIALLVSFLDNRIGNVLLVLFLAYFITDLIITILAIMKIKRRLVVLDDIAQKIRSNSDDIGVNIYKGVTLAINTKDNVVQKLDKQKVELEDNLEERKQKIEELMVKYEELIKDKGFVHRRLEKAFPNIRERLSKYNHFRKDE